MVEKQLPSMHPSWLYLSKRDYSFFIDNWYHSLDFSQKELTIDSAGICPIHNLYARIE